jgi:putative CocE/NonD family hydrolase
VPTLITQTPYLRAVEFRGRWAERVATKLAFLGTSDFAEECVRYGYAFVLMDLRGAGASYGHKTSNLMVDAVRDGSDVLDWVVAQPWSNGRVGATGVSAHGLAAQWLVTAKNDALKAIVPRFTAFDIFSSTRPGGGTASRFMIDVGSLLRAMDSNQLHRMPEQRFARLLMRAMVRGLKPVDGDRDRRQLAEAVRDHAANESFDQDLVTIEHRDDPLPTAPSMTVDTQSPSRFAADMEAAGVPIYAYGGWLDAAFQRELINLHNTVRTPGSQLLIGPWAHGGKFYCSPVVDGRRRTDFPHAAEIVRFCDRFLRPADDSLGAAAEEPVHYFSMGEERWKSAPAWPPPATRTAFFLQAGGRLTASSPEDTEGSDGYTVDYDVGTGVHSRFGKHLSSELFPARYPNRREADERLLCYDSPALEVDTEVTGHPLVTLYVTSTASDGLFIVYLEDVDPDGTVRNVTDGWLRAKFRPLGTGEPPYPQAPPYRTFRRDDTVTLHPGEVAALVFDLFPVSWLFRRGHAVRVAIAGADKDNLVDVARAESPQVSVLRGGAHPSRIELPVVTGEKGARP